MVRDLACQYGDKCRFSHDMNLVREARRKVADLKNDELKSANANQNSIQQQQMAAMVEAAVAAVKGKGKGKGGDKTEGKGEQAKSQDRKSVCFAFLKGSCTKGKDCPYSHSPKVAQSTIAAIESAYREAPQGSKEQSGRGRRRRWRNSPEPRGRRAYWSGCRPMDQAGRAGSGRGVLHRSAPPATFVRRRGGSAADAREVPRRHSCRRLRED